MILSQAPTTGLANRVATRAGALGAVLLIASACAGSAGTPTPVATGAAASPSPSRAPAEPTPILVPTANPTPQSSRDAAGVIWLCRPGLVADPCSGPLDTTVVDPAGRLSTVSPRPAADAPIDCFFVYPTASDATTPQADFTIDAGIKLSAVREAAPFGQVCKVYAPVYRQLTGVGLNGATEAQIEIAYGDVEKAFDDYIANYNKGRGFVVMGHSQGGELLAQLMTRVIDPDSSLRKKLVAGYLFGANIYVPKGKKVGGDFKNIGACTSARQVGCVVAYSSFEDVPPADGPYARPEGPWRMFAAPTLAEPDILCVNPASLAGGSGVLEPLWYTPDVSSFPLSLSPAPETPYVTYADQLKAKCATDGDGNWLQISRSEPNVLPLISGSEGNEFGLHDFDVALAMGNVIDLIGTQAKSYAAS